MAKKHLLPQENEEFLDRLGLTDIDTRVYIATLDGGLVSLGEIQQLTEIDDLGRILESVRDLIDVGLVKKAQGTMRRYYATLPFFRETLSVEREFKFALEAMLKSLSKAKENTVQNRERIVAMRFPKIVDNLLDKYYKEILAPFIKNLEDMQEDIQDGMMTFIKDVESTNDGIKEEISLMLKPVQDYISLANQKFDLGVTNETGELKQYLTNRKQSRLQLLQTAHDAIGEHLKTMRGEITNLSGELRSVQTTLREEVNRLQTNSQMLSDKITTFQTSIDQIDSAKQEIQAELVVAREQVKKAINSTDTDPSAKVDEIFSNLTQKIKIVDMGSADMTDNLNSVQTSVNTSYTAMDQVVSSLDQTITAIQGRLTTTFEDLKSKMTEIFNQLNDQDEKSLQQLRDKIEMEMKQLGDKIKDEGSTVIDKLHSHMDTIKKQQKDSLQQYEDKLVSLYDRPLNHIKPFLENWVDDIEPVIDEFKNKSDEALIDILQPIQDLEEGTFSTLTERIGFVRAMIEGRSNDLQQVLDHAKEFDFTKTADTSVVVGLPAIYASLTDLLLRTKTKVTVVTPYLDLELVEVARTLKSSVRITFVTDIDPDKDARLIKKLDDMGRVNLRNYPDRDLYACIRDSEEIIFGYIKDGEETIGIRTSTPSMVELLGDRLNETVIRNSKQL